MTDIDIDEIEKQGGSALRKQLEKALATNKEISGELVRLKATSVINEGGFSTVTVEDLEGVSLDELEAKAEALHTERSEQAESLIRNALAKRGLDGDDLDEAVKALTSSDTDTPEPVTFGRSSDMQGLQGSPLPSIDAETLANLSPRQEMEMGFDQAAKKKSLKI